MRVDPSVGRAQAPAADVPIFKITPLQSAIKFGVKASVPTEGTFKEWEAAMTFTSTDPSTGVLDIKMDAASVDTGSGMKDDKLRSKDFFNAKNDPYIMFHSTKVVQTGADTFEVDGKFTIRGVTKDKKLEMKVFGARAGSGTIQGTMAFDRKEYGMNSGIPFIKIADRVEVNVALKGERISGPPMVLKKF